MTRMIGKRPLTLAALALALTAVPACATMGDLIRDDVGLNGGSSLVRGEVRSIDARRGRLQVREDHGRNITVSVDGRTRVVYRQRQYPLSALERGDLVRMRVTYDRRGNAWADRVDVQESVRDRRVATSRRIARVDGVVRSIDTRRGHFTVERSRTNRVVVYAPRGLRGEDARRLQRLRRGDRVRVDVYMVSQNQAELVRFR
jgi:hypothetical protein